MAEKQNPIKIKGIVSSGKQEGKNFVGLSWVQKQFKEKLGFKPYLGTVNLVLNEKESKKRKKLEKLKGIRIIPEKGFCEAKCFRAKILGFNVKAAVVLPLVEGYPKNLIEIVSPCNLREELKLKEGDHLELLVFSD